MSEESKGEAFSISLEGVRQNNLKNINLEIPVGRLIAVSGVSGSGKSSFAVETLCAEGQRRYIESFSPYARQFMERIGKPDVDSVRDIPPAISIYQGNPIRTSRSTVATMSEIADFVKVLFARASGVVCSGCSREVRRESLDDVTAAVKESLHGRAVIISFPVVLAGGYKPDEIVGFLKAQGFTRLVHDGEVRPVSKKLVTKRSSKIEVVMDSVTVKEASHGRIADSIREALGFGQGRVNVTPVEAGGGRVTRESRLRFSDSLHCPYCDIQYPPPDQSFFSYNSPLGACNKCRGFGNIIQIDRGKVIPDARKPLADGAIRPWKSGYSARYYDKLQRFCGREGIPLDVPWERLDEEHRRLIWEGKGSWHGIGGYFKYLEKRSYKMHFRVLLARYRSYDPCPVCAGKRFRPDVLVYRVDGKTISDFFGMSVQRALGFIRSILPSAKQDPATTMLAGEIIRRLDYMEKTGLGYLTLERESRTLSGGEVGRLRLASALGANLTGTLYVLDEPTVGLHPRDIDRLLDVLKELRGRGNTVVIVEHDMRVLRASDLLIDLGPGPGAKGGEVVFFGPPWRADAAGRSLTLKYLRGEKSADMTRPRRARERTRTLRVKDASMRNLAGMDVDIPLGLFVCVTGVSGSGKSTLVRDVLGASLKNFLEGREAHPVGCSGVRGWRELVDVVLVDQTPLSSTPRANPATYTRLTAPLRKLFASAPLARTRRYKPSKFSFNSKAGRCPECAGTGYEKIEMQFLSDLYVKCQYCDGKRFKKAVLDVTVDGKNLSDVLSMTIDEASEFLGSRAPGAGRTVDILKKVGLGYLTLGQPFTTLSSGEIQRLKLAGILAEKSRKGHRLILMDEPTTGLHADDVGRLLDLIHGLVDDGDSVVMVEHNMEVVKCCDWVIDLGPEGGERGGRVVAAGTPEDVAQWGESRTAPYLAEALAGGAGAGIPAAREEPAVLRPSSAGIEDDGGSIEIVGARQNNLRGVNAKIPLGKITLVTGVSGSGKSSLVFDVLFAEGQRRFLDSVSPYVRQYLKQIPHPDVDYISRLPPTIAIEQRSSRGGVRSTVGTLTEIHPFLRLMFARLGERRCPACNLPVNPRSTDAIVAQLRGSFQGMGVKLLAPLVKGRKGRHQAAMKGALKKGYQEARVDGETVSLRKIPELDRYRDHFIEILAGRIVPGKTGGREAGTMIRDALALGKGVLIASPEEGEDMVLSTLDRCPQCGKGFDELDPRNFSFNSPLGACPACRGLGTPGTAGRRAEQFFFEDVGEDDGSIETAACPACAGRRLKEEYLNVLLQGWNIAQLCGLGIDKAREVIGNMKFDERGERIASPVRGEVLSRMSFLERVGVGYLSLDRRADTLSAGESQRVKLAASLGSELRGVCYILDEPTIGLHPADNRMIRGVLKELKQKGSTIVVVEHDEETIRSADYCIELGPGGGREGGEIVARGAPEDIALQPQCPTGRILSDPVRHPMRGAHRPPGDEKLEILGARAHNLRNVDIRLPLGLLVCITGVSGSGKSSLLENVIFEGYRLASGQARGHARAFDRIEGFELVKSMKYVDQAPIGRTPRSTVSTYTNIMTVIRDLFAGLPEARMRGTGPSHFSFNVKGGRCDECKGQGMIAARMTFLPLVHVECDKCGGKRYNDEILKIRYRGRSIADVLAMTVSEARSFFSVHGKIVAPLDILEEIGLGYLLLGQSSPTLSGGEAQRLKLAAEMGGRGTAAGAMVLLEEPTTGLHTLDVVKLIAALHRLVDAGATVVVIEHNLDVIAEADWIIDLGPGGGEAGGRCVAMGTVPELVRKPGMSLTARYLKKRLSI
ncbi:MAG: excinuclease ABC subunit UvrA [Pseudomonadota bacterium]